MRTPSHPPSICGTSAARNGALLRRCAPAGIALAAMLTWKQASAQTVRNLTVCTPDSFQVCSDLRLTANGNAFEIGLHPLTSLSGPSNPISIYNLVFGTGAAAASSPLTTGLAPTAIGGATVSDASNWEVFDSGDALFLSALSNRGIGGCVSGADIAGFGQAARTCGAGQFIAFAFTGTRAFDPYAFTVLDFEVAVLTDPIGGASCGSDDAVCRLSVPVTSTPEPATTVMMAIGLLGFVCTARLRGNKS